MKYSPETFGCQTAYDCGMAENFARMHARLPEEILDATPGEIMQICIETQSQLRELAQQEGRDYDSFVQIAAEEMNCPLYVLATKTRNQSPNTAT